MTRLRTQVDASWLSMIAFVTVVVALGWGVFTYEQYRSVNRLLSDQHGVALEAAWGASSRMYRISAAIMVDDLSRHPAVTDWFEEANDVDEPGRERLRSWFRSLLRPDYLRLRVEGFEIFQLHTADGRVLLRFHDEGRHGDEVAALRPSVAIAHAGREPVVAVERDGDDPALRHVFPRVYQDRLLGSIELGVPFLRIQEQLGQILNDNLFALVMRRPAGPGAVSSGLHDELVIAERQLPPDMREAIESGRLAAVFEDLARRDTVRTLAFGNVRRTFSVLVHNEGYFASFLPMANNGTQDAWLLAIHPARELVATRRQFLLQGAVGALGIGSLGVALGLLQLAVRRRRMEEQRYRDVVTNIQEVIFRADRTGHLTFLNPAWETLTDFPVAQTLGRRAIEFIHPDDRSRFVGFLQPLLRREQDVLREEFRYLRADGGVRWVEVFVHLSLDERRQANGVYGTLMDVSERRRITDALRAERDLFAAGPAIAFIWRNEPGWPVDYISDNVVTGLGYMPQHLLDPAFRFASLIHPDDLARIEGEGREHRALRRTSFEMNYRIRDVHGEYRWFREYSMPGWEETRDNGVPLRIRGYLLDETATVEALEALEQSRQRLAWILEGADVGTWEWDIAAGVFTINERWAAMLGYALDELTPLATAAWRGLMHPEDRDKCQARMHAYLDEGSGYFEGEHRLRHKDGSWLWVLMRGRILARTADGAPRLMCGTQMDITRRKAAEAHAAHLAYYDELTGLANRRMLLEQLRHALASSARTHYLGALLFIDLDNFKNLNDTLGHDYGDLLLREVAARLRSIVRGSDSVSRLGGDEFVVLFEELDTDEDRAIANAERAVRKVLATLSEPYALKEYEHHLTPSIGVTLFGRGRETSETLMKKADLAMYQAKAEGKGTFRFFDPDMQAAAEHQRQVEVALRRALEESQFLVAYQPIADFGGRIVAVEALLRWKHPERGMVSPAEFIPVAEKAGLISALGRWVLQTACGQLAVWKEDPQRAVLSMAVNVSPVQFLQPEFVDEVLAVLRESGADGRRLRLEITESMLLDNVEEAIGRMSVLREHGVSFSLDDFGTGYSSLNYLKRLPISVLKIDQSFVRDIEIDPNDAAIVQTIIAMAHLLGLKVVAEGVESAGQRDFLVAHGCDYLQGYLLHRPMFIDSLEALLE